MGYLCVSIPYRYAKNAKQKNRRLSLYFVSIPYRYAKNYTVTLTVPNYLDTFQFLIGTLKTFTGITHPFPLSQEFQFLIGTLKTVALNPRFTSVSSFQFLIGTLKTTRHKKIKSRGQYVSIPYRYAKNEPTSFSLAYLFLFQFLIGTLKTGRMEGRVRKMAIVSIPYRYAKNQDYRYGQKSPKIVSIPYRYAKN